MSGSSGRHRDPVVPLFDLRAQYRELKPQFDSAIAAVLDSGQFVRGAEVAAFEQQAARYLDVPYVISCGSGTDALHLSLRALGIGPGDEVITSAFTFAATAEAIRYTGATPRFVDIDPVTFTIDPAEVARAVGPRTRALLPVHLFGHPAALSELQAIAVDAGLPLIEDCAQSFGARYRDRTTGSFGTAGCFSFFPTKNLGAFGDGGMICTASAELDQLLRSLRNHGAAASASTEHRIIGYNSRLDEIQAAILRVKLTYLDRFNRARRRIAQRYSEAFATLPGLTLPGEAPDCHHVYHQFTVLTPHRDAVLQRLRDQQIGCTAYYTTPLHRQPAFATEVPVHLPVTDRVASHCLSLPMFPELRDQQLDQVIDAMHHAIAAVQG